MRSTYTHRCAVLLWVYQSKGELQQQDQGQKNGHDSCCLTCNVVCVYVNVPRNHPTNFSQNCSTILKTKRSNMSSARSCFFLFNLPLVVIDFALNYLCTCMFQNVLYLEGKKRIIELCVCFVLSFDGR